MFRTGDNEVVVAINAKSGETLWEHAYPEPVWKEFDGFKDVYIAGPVSTPLVLGDFVFAIGARTELRCLNKNTGVKVWSHNLWDEFGAPPSERGYTTSPIAYKNLLLVPAGGKGHGLIAFDQKTGEVVWAKHDFENRFSSPIIVTIDGQEQLIAFVAEKVAGMEPSTGELLWQYPHISQWNVHASTPLWGKDDNILFISCAYNSGSRAMRVTRKEGQTSAEELWFTRKARVHHGTTVRLDSLVLCSSGDFGPAFLMALNAETGDIIHQMRGFGKANLVLSGLTDKTN